MTKKVICTNAGKCHMCAADAPPPNLVRGRAYTVLEEVTFGELIGYVLLEAPLEEGYVHCVPHFTELSGASPLFIKSITKRIPEHA